MIPGWTSREFEGQWYVSEEQVQMFVDSHAALEAENEQLRELLGRACDGFRFGDSNLLNACRAMLGRPE